MKRKVNPRRIPVSMADVEAAKTEGVEMGLLLTLWTLADKHNQNKDELRQFWEEMWDTIDSINRQYITWDDLRKTLEEEYDITVEASK